MNKSVLEAKIAKSKSRNIYKESIYKYLKRIIYNWYIKTFREKEIADYDIDKKRYVLFSEKEVLACLEAEQEENIWPELVNSEGQIKEPKSGFSNRTYRSVIRRGAV